LTPWIITDQVPWIPWISIWWHVTGAWCLHGQGSRRISVDTASYYSRM